MCRKANKTSKNMSPLEKEKKKKVAEKLQHVLSPLKKSIFKMKKILDLQLPPNP